jgi:hypothetical protein
MSWDARRLNSLKKEQAKEGAFIEDGDQGDSSPAYM